MKLKRLPLKKIKKHYSKEKVVIFIKTDQLMDYYLERDDGISVNYDKVLIINDILNFSISDSPEEVLVKIVDYINDEFMMIELENIEKAKDKLRELDTDEIRPHLYADLWIDGQFTKENT